MSGQTWTPPNITPICLEQQVPLTQCSTTGYLFLALISQFYGGSKDNKPTEYPDFVDLSYPSTLSPYFGESEVPLGPVLLKTEDIQTKPSIGPTVLQQNHEHFFSKKFSRPVKTLTKVYSHGPGGSHGVSQVTSYFPKFDFEKYSTGNTKDPIFEYDNSFSPSNSKFQFGDLDFGFKKKVFSDVEPASTDTMFSEIEPANTDKSVSKFEPMISDDWFPDDGVKPANSDKRTVNAEKNMQTKTRERQAINRDPIFEFEDPVLNSNSKNSRDLLVEFAKKMFSDIKSANTDKMDSEDEPANSEKEAVKAEKKMQAKTRTKRQETEKYDFIVVGAGSAGCVIANRLSEVKQWKILLIEAGPEEPDVTSVPAFAPVLGRSSIDWNYRTQPEELTCRAQRGQTCAWLSGRVMGGSSSINYVVYMRGNKKDYDEWARRGNEGWSYNEVLHYFKKSENNQNFANDSYHGNRGPLNVELFAYSDPNVNMLVKAFHEKGFPIVDFNGKQQIGTMITQTTTKNGRRVSSNVAFIRPIRNKRPNLTIMTNAEVIKVLIDENMQAYGVQYYKNHKIYNAVTKKEVIISAGALNSPKILMLSGIGPKSDLMELGIPVLMDLKVGHNLQDHVTTEAVLMTLTKTSTSLKGNEIVKAVQDFYRKKTKFNEFNATGPLQITAFHRTKYAKYTDKDKRVPDIQFHFDGRNKRDFYQDPSSYLASNIFPFSFYDSINVRPILLRPRSRGYLTLNKTHPISGQPLIYPRFFTVKHDLDILVAALKFAVKLEETNAFMENKVKFIRKPVEPCTSHKWGSSKYFECVLTSYTGTIYHPVGTCKMGPRHDKNAVVDARLRVYGIQSLRVADASIMPNIVRGNTNAPCMMIGEKVSDMIKEDWDSIYWDR